jgi:hypothetical protein
MAIPEKSGNIKLNESGTLPDLPKKMMDDTETANWWFEARSVLNRQQDAIDDKVSPTNVSFTLPSTSPIEYEYTHNLGKFPLVQVLDGDNESISATVVTITHDSVNKFTVSSASPLTGTLIIH